MNGFAKTFVGFIVLAGIVCAQQYRAGYMVAPSGKLTEEHVQVIEDKLKTAMISSGIAVSDGFFPMVLVVKYNEQETIKISGIRATYKSRARLHLYLCFASDNGMVGSTSFEVEGAGSSEEQARMNALYSFEIPKMKMTKLLDQLQDNYQSSLENFSVAALAKAKKLKAKGDYDAAIESAAQVPAESNKSPEAESIIVSCEKLLLQKEEQQNKLREKELQIEQTKVDNERKKNESAAKLEEKRIETEGKIEIERARKEIEAMHNDRANALQIYQSLVPKLIDR